MRDNLDKVRKELKLKKVSELSEILNNLDISEIWKERQDLIKQMNIAKLKASEEAAIPFLEKIEKIDKEYSIILTLLAK